MKRILITDDDQFLANVCRRKFEEAGFHVRIATDGHAAIEELVLHPPDVVLLDLMLPELDGVAVLRFLRSREKLRELPVIVVSNLSYFSGVVQSAWQAGATYFFNKEDCSPAGLVEAALKVVTPDQRPPASSHAPVEASLPPTPPPLPRPERGQKTSTAPPQTPAPSPATRASSDQPPRQYNARAANILIADDDKVIQGVLTFFLTQAGFFVRSAFDGEQALEMARAHAPDILVLDGRMPKLDGFEVLKRWSLSPLAKIPVIMLTSEDDEAMKADALGSGAVAYLTKPFSPDDLVRRATELTRGRR